MASSVPRPDRRRLALAAVLFAILLIPVLAGLVLGIGAGGIYLVIGTIVVAPTGMTLGRRPALGAALGAGVATGVMLPLASNPWAAGVWIAVLGLAVGIATIRGVETAVAGPAMTAALLSGGGAEPWAPLAIVAGGIYGAVVTGVLTHGRATTAVPLERQRALLYAAVLAVGLGVLTAVPLELGIPHGYWAPVTVLALAAPWPGLTSSRAGERVAGTITGAIAALLVASAIPVPALLATLALVTGFAGVYYLERNSRRSALLTAAIVLLGGSGGEADATAAARIAMVVAAALVIVLIAYILRWTSRATPVAELKRARPAVEEGPR